MSDASVEYRSQPDRNWVGRVPFLTAFGEVLVLANDPETGAALLCRSLWNWPASAKGPNSHGV